MATPNHLHYPVAKAFLERGIAVVCDKPLAHSVDDARALCTLVASSGELFALTHPYTGYPAVREARERVRQGHLGEIRKVLLEYQQGGYPVAADGLRGMNFVARVVESSRHGGRWVDV